MTAISIVGVFIGLIVLVFCSMKGLSVFISAILASAVIALTGAVSLEQAILTDFMRGFVGFITSNFMVFAAGALMGKAYEITHGAQAVARLFIRLFSKKLAPFALLIAIMLMTGGGIAGFVLAFAMFPIAAEIFREVDAPRTIIPGLIVTGCCTASSWGAFVAQPVNNIYATTFHTTLGGAAVPSIIMMIASVITSCIFLQIFLVRARKRGEHYVPSQYDVPSSKEDLPNGIVALIPLIVALLLINIRINGEPLLPTAFGIFVGAVLAVILMFKSKTDNTSIPVHIGNAFQNALTSIGNTAAMSAVGTVAQATVGFTVMINGLTSMGGNPLISAAVCAAIACFVTGGATGGTSMIGPTLASTYGAMGVDIAMLGRIVVATGHITGTLPNGGFINTTITGIAHDTYKSCFKYSFFLCTVANFVAVIVGIIVMSILGIYM